MGHLNASLRFCVGNIFPVFCYFFRLSSSFLSSCFFNSFKDIAHMLRYSRFSASSSLGILFVQKYLLNPYRWHFVVNFTKEIGTNWASSNKVHENDLFIS